MQLLLAVLRLVSVVRVIKSNAADSANGSTLGSLTPSFYNAGKQPRAPTFPLCATFSGAFTECFY
jgi:hypothetical protein